MGTKKKPMGALTEGERQALRASLQFHRTYMDELHARQMDLNKLTAATLKNIQEIRRTLEE